MEIRDLQEVDLKDVIEPCICEESNKQFAAGAPAKLMWLKEIIKKGLMAKIAYEEENPIGFIDYIPIEHAPAAITGKNLIYLNCIYVIRPFWGKGYREALLKAAEKEASNLSKGMVVTAYDHKHWFFPMAFFKKYGYKEVDRRGKRVLMMKEFEPVESPKFLDLKYKPKLVPNKVVVDAFWNGLCPHSTVVIARLRKVCAEFERTVILREVRTFKWEIFEKYRISFGIFINGEKKFGGHPRTEQEIREELIKTIRKI